MTGTALAYAHRFEPASAPGRPTLLLLHGTGGDEHDLIPLGRLLAPGAAMLSPRGNVLERGAPRFFRRFAEGVFDTADVARRASELADFLNAASARYDFALDNVVAVGFSNGANIAGALLLLHPGAPERVGTQEQHGAGDVRAVREADGNDLVEREAVARARRIQEVRELA
ncbi:MAG TPA: hypothetical protein VMS45_09460, partial [Gemmatimonadaceae bacterium]|nr:hypothetical protein [Gemmatimonadaceae bacterium]